MKRILFAILSLTMTLSAHAELTSDQKADAEMNGRAWAPYYYQEFKEGLFTTQQLNNNTIDNFKADALQDNVQTREDITAYLQIAANALVKGVKLIED